MFPLRIATLGSLFVVVFPSERRLHSAKARGMRGFIQQKEETIASADFKRAWG
jgi:hypothetical protein